MSTMSDEQGWAGHDAPPPLAISAQRKVVLDFEAGETALLGARWREVADLLDAVVADYEEHLENGACAAQRADAGHALEQVMAAFDIASATARHNADVLDDAASEITLAQARLGAIWREYESERGAASPAASERTDRRFGMRSAREVWYPLDGAIAEASARLRPVALLEFPDVDQDSANRAVIPLIRQ